MKSVCESRQNLEQDVEEIIQNGTYLLIQRADAERIVEFKEDESLSYGRGFNLQEIKLKNINGCPFYSTFRIKPSSEKRRGLDGKPAGQLCDLELVTNVRKESAIDKNNLSTSSSTENSSGRDNRNILDDGKAQSLGSTDIATLREQGICGREILDQLVSSSKTFNQKTEFSQEKYLRKKEKLYGDTILVLKPTLSLIMDYYYQRDPSKIMNLRLDSMAQMLSYANIHSNGKFLVYETGCFGLLIAGILQRLGGSGLALHVHTGSTPQRQALYFMNFKKEELEPLKSLDVFYLIRPTTSNSKSESKSNSSPHILPEDTTEESELAEPRSKKFKSSEDSEENPENSVAEESSLQEVSLIADENSENNDGDKIQETTSVMSSFVSINRLENERSLLLLQSTEFDGLLICAKEHPLSITQRLLPHLAPSAPFVIFCQYAEPLIECYNWIKDFNLGVNLNLVESWFRTIQVEPERTHPEINMSSSGGFLLHGISIHIKL